MSYLDSRDLQERIDELVALEEHYEEYKGLILLKEEVNSDEWDDGITFIPEDEFTEYAMELLQDIGELPQDIPWYIEIDEEKTAENIKQDYSSVDFQGTTYWYRD